MTGPREAEYGGELGRLHGHERDGAHDEGARHVGLAGTQLDLWDCNGGGNQSWNVEGNELRIYGTNCMTVGGSGGTAGGTAGDPVVITDCTGATSQQWTANANQSITSVANPALCLNAAGTGNGSPVNVATCNGDSNQAWTRS